MSCVCVCVASLPFCQYPAFKLRTHQWWRWFVEIVQKREPIWLRWENKSIFIVNTISFDVINSIFSFGIWVKRAQRNIILTIYNLIFAICFYKLFVAHRNFMKTFIEWFCSTIDLNTLRSMVVFFGFRCHILGVGIHDCQIFVIIMSHLI